MASHELSIYAWRISNKTGQPATSGRYFPIVNTSRNRSKMLWSTDLWLHDCRHLQTLEKDDTETTNTTSVADDVQTTSRWRVEDTAGQMTTMMMMMMLNDVDSWPVGSPTILRRCQPRHVKLPTSACPEPDTGPWQYSAYTMSQKISRFFFTHNFDQGSPTRTAIFRRRQPRRVPLQSCGRNDITYWRSRDRLKLH